MDTLSIKSKRLTSKFFKEHVGSPDLHKILDEYDIEKIKGSFDKEERNELNLEQLQKLLTEVTRHIFDTTPFTLMFMQMNSRGLDNNIF